jgi:hypothetical protein
MQKAKRATVKVSPTGAEIMRLFVGATFTVALKLIFYARFNTELMSDKIAPDLIIILH